MTATTVSFPRTSTEVARRIAEDIAMFGHLQGGIVTDEWSNDIDNPTGLCCIYVNPTTHALTAAGKDYLTDRFENRLREVIFAQGFDSIVRWSDTTPTEQVIDTLRNL